MGCPVSGKELFDLENNLGWPKINSLTLNGSGNDNFSNNIGFSNVCQYNFSALKILQFGKLKLIQKISN